MVGKGRKLHCLVAVLVEVWEEYAKAKERKKRDRTLEEMYNICVMCNFSTHKRRVERHKSFVADGKERYLGANVTSALLSLQLTLHDRTELKHADNTSLTRTD